MREFKTPADSLEYIMETLDDVIGHCASQCPSCFDVYHGPGYQEGDCEMIPELREALEQAVNLGMDIQALELE